MRIVPINRNIGKILIGFISSILILPHIFLVSAVEERVGLTFSIAPPVFKIALSPGDTWSSSIKIINANSNEITFNASIMDYDAVPGEESGGNLIFNQNNFLSDTTPADWVQLDQSGNLGVKSQSSADIPFTIKIPEDSSPGEYFVAIVVSDESVIINKDDVALRVSGAVASILYIRVNGEVIESGSIREFSTDRFIYKDPDITFTLRIQNDGNVSLRPEGTITIFNFLGEKVDELQLVRADDFGSILPKSIREYVVRGGEDKDIFKGGLYSAEVEIGFGGETKLSDEASLRFWVLPITSWAVIFLVVLVFGFFLWWLVGKYTVTILRREVRELRNWLNH